MALTVDGACETLTKPPQGLRTACEAAVNSARVRRLPWCRFNGRARFDRPRVAGA
jgi:hypothetical protein